MKIGNVETEIKSIPFKVQHLTSAFLYYIWQQLPWPGVSLRFQHAASFSQGFNFIQHVRKCKKTNKQKKPPFIHC